MENNALADDFWLHNLPSSHADYLSYTEIELGRHPSAFLVYQNQQKFIKQVPEHIQKIEYSILSWLEELQLDSNPSVSKTSISKQRPTELQLPKPDALTSRSDLLITSKLDGTQLTKSSLISRFPLVCKILVYLHQLVEVTKLPSIIVYSLDYELPISSDDVEGCYLELFNQAKINIADNISIIGFIHGDLSMGNILVTNSSIGIVDWEYANVRDCRWDLATIAVEFELNSDEFNNLCDVYLKQKGLQEDNFIDVAKSWAVIYAITCLSWAKKNNQQTNRYMQFLTRLVKN
jgi:thiamine kinase-like enzyme